MSVEHANGKRLPLREHRFIGKPSFQEAVLDSRDRLFSITLRICSSFQDAEDVFQEALMRAFSRWDSYDPSQSALTTWFRTIVRNCAIDDYRKKQTRVRGDVLYAEFNEADPRFGHDFHSSQQIVAKDDTFRSFGALLQEGMSALSPEQRTVIELMQNGHSFPEIADIQKEPLGTIKSRARLGKVHLMSFLMEHGVTADVLTLA